MSAGVVIGPGVRIRESIILENAIINDHTLVLHAIGIERKLYSISNYKKLRFPIIYDYFI